MKRKEFLYFLVAALATLPGIVLRLAGLQWPPAAMAIISGVAILGASFLLLWACDAAQADISQSLALAVVALVAVLPEYAVDMYFTWEAGKHPEGDYAHYAIANMTGANRLLIGVAWAVIVLLHWLRTRRAVRLEKDRRTELLFLGLATVYAFVIPLKGSLAWYDGLVYLGLYGWYIVVAGRRPCVESPAEGPAELLIHLPKVKRRVLTAMMFLFAAAAIAANAEPFCEGLVATGKALHINEFLLVQWLAPLASEAPEFTVAVVFAWRGQAGLALGSLLSSKLNQWTLLVGMIPGVFAVSHGTLDHPLPMDERQMQEILLTAAQSLLAVLLLAGRRLALSGALLLFVLFTGQLVAPSLVEAFPSLVPKGVEASQMHWLFSGLYLAAAAAVFLQHPKRPFGLLSGAQVGEQPMASKSTSNAAAVPCCGRTEAQAAEEFKSPHCATCEYRLRAKRTEVNGG